MSTPDVDANDPRVTVDMPVLPAVSWPSIHVQSVTAYRPGCACGWEGQPEMSVELALRSTAFHLRDHHTAKAPEPGPNAGIKGVTQADRERDTYRPPPSFGGQRGSEAGCYG